MSDNFIKKLKYNGVVGAGGACFPTYVKAQSSVEFMIANGAECEPLIHKDFELMKNFPEEIIAGMLLMMKATNAKKGKFGVKEKNYEAVENIEKFTKNKNIDTVLLGDFYPSGDEYELVYEATGRLIPPAGIPLKVGCVVNNVETLYNVNNANNDIPVTRKILTVTGLVNEPKTFFVPIGTSFGECIKLAGGSKITDFAICVSGIMMGGLTFDLNEVVTKSTAGLIILPKDHYLVKRKTQPIENMNRIGKSACDQCSYCTEFCPRYLLGYEVMPHKVMRSLGFTLSGKELWNQWAELCCACGLCTLYSCPEDLFPKEACDNAKQDMRKAGIKFVQQSPPRVHPMKTARKVPQSLLRKRLKIDDYEQKTPFENIDFKPSIVKIYLNQHIGKPAIAMVKSGQKVSVNDVIAKVDDNDLGVYLHSSIDGRVTEITDKYIKIEK